MKLKWNAASIAIGIVCLVTAFIITLQLKSVIYNHAVSSEETLRAEELLKQLNQERLNNDNLRDQLYEQKEAIRSYREEAASNSDYSKTLLSQLEKAENLAGLTALEGSGVVVTLSDSHATNTVGDPNLYIIHDSDILSVVNELCDAGAEAISINGERLISTSEIRCAGSTVSVNNNRYSQPYVIKAIGDPVNMENALLMRDGVYDTLLAWGLEVDIKKVSKHTVEAYKGNISYKYAAPVAETPAE